MVGELSIRPKFNWVSLIAIILLLSLCSCRWTPRSGHSQNHAIEHSTTADDSEYEGYGRKRERTKHHGKVTIPMEIDGGVYMISAKINDVPMKFVFDTGASMISLSLTETNFLIKQGTIDGNDVLGEMQFVDANGDVSTGYGIRLRTVQLGDIVLHDVRASVVPNQTAPLLMGQSALQEFGTIKIDNKHRCLILEN